MQHFITRFSKTWVLVFALLLSFSACDSDNGGNDRTEPSGSLTATVGGSAYSANSITILTNNGLTLSTRSEDGRSLSLTFLNIDSTGPFPLINRALTPGAGVAGGYFANSETYNIDTGTVNISTYTNSRIAGTFVGTASGLLGATDLPILDGAFDVEY